MIESGFYCLNKPKGISSNGCLNNFKKENKIPRSVKVGYAGTLDMLAEGLLVVAVGKEFTKQLQHISNSNKTYVADINISGWTESGDLEQPINSNEKSDPPSLEQVEKVLASMLGPQMQKPPAFSAKKVNGQRAYNMAREGQAVELKSCPIEFFNINLISYSYPTIKIEVTCSKGTFIRVLAMDIGKALTGGGYIEKLVRTKVDRFEIDS